ncbi:methyltransferase domain-containing protein [bacterium]|nr:methyltransferase domain-containing protein [bacterium]
MLPVDRSKADAQRYYDRMSKIYDWLTASERSLIEKGVTQLAPQQGETILEIGCGTGTGLELMSAGLRGTGELIGLDISRRMLHKAQQKDFITNKNTVLIQGDATRLPIRDHSVDAVYCAYTLELFSQSEMSVLLDDIKRILTPQGRLAVLALSRTPHNLAVRIYELGHRLLPVALDCRPIPLAGILNQAGFTINHAEKVMNWGLPVDLILATQG